MTETSEENQLSTEQHKLDDKRLWIGNLDPRISEYQLLKLLQKHGDIEKFDLLFHRSGPLTGQPRGYAFVTYMKKSDAVKAITNLHHRPVGSKNIVVTWAHSMTTEDMEKPKPEINIPALAIAKPEKKTNREFQIQAIEAKLKLMERKSDELVINKTVATEISVMTQFQQNKQPCSSGNGSTVPKSRNNFKKTYSKPYSKHKSRR